MNREEAINVVKCNWPEGRHQLSEALKTLIPEFQESEDEMIRNRIIGYLKLDIEEHPEREERINEMLAYLERQEEYIEDIRQYAYNKGLVDAEQKPAEWSKEDEMRLKEALEVLNESIKHLPMGYGYTKDVMLVTDWLTSLPKRFNLIPKQEWSEDEMIRRCIYDVIKENDWSHIFGVKKEDCFAYLERQKDEAQKQFNLGIQAGKEEAMYEMEKEQKPDTEETELNSIAFLEQLGYTCVPPGAEKKPAKMDNEEIELSDFESELFSAFSDGWQQYLHGEKVDVAQWAKEHSAQLLNAAKQELKPAEWSDKDKEMLEKVLECIRFAEDRYQLEEEQMNGVSVRLWLLEHINPQPYWKPSAEQMKALLSKLPVVKGSGDKVQDILESLYSDLKKL